MTDKKISQLDAAATLGGTEMVEVVQNGVNVRTTAMALAGLGGSSAVVTYKYSYSFAVDGGATGTIVLRQSTGGLPTGFIVQTAWIDVLTVLGSAGAATAALATSQSVGDLVVATSYASPPWSMVRQATTSAFLIDSSYAGLKLTSSRSPTLTIAGAALNAGIFNLYVQGVQS